MTEKELEKLKVNILQVLRDWEREASGIWFGFDKLKSDLKKYNRKVYNINDLSTVLFYLAKEKKVFRDHTFNERGISMGYGYYINEYYYDIKESFRMHLNEHLEINNNEVFINEPYDNIQKNDVNGYTVYTLFGNVDYYSNKEAILAIKNKNNLTVNKNYYNSFLKELHTRFYSIPELSNSDMLVSIETTAPINVDIINSIDKPNVTNGFKKINKSFKMRDIDIENRSKMSNIFYKDFNHDNMNTICVVDDFITSGSSFKNAFDTLPMEINKVGIALFKLIS